MNHLSKFKTFSVKLLKQKQCSLHQIDTYLYMRFHLRQKAAQIYRKSELKCIGCIEGF